MNTYIEVEPGIELYVQDTGSGDPIIFIPGFTFTTEVFTEQVEHFSKTRRTIVIDPRSHGRSTITVHGNDYVTHGTDLGKVLKQLKVENATLVGWSFGCLTLWEYIRQFGADGIKTLVFIDMPPKSLSLNQDKEWVEGPLDDMAAAYTNYLRNPKGQRDFISAYATGVMVQRELKDDELNWIVEQSLKTPYYIAANLFSSGLFSDYRVEAAESSEALPTLYVVAEHWAKAAVSTVSTLAPKASVEVLGGHLMFWEHSEKFNELVDSFLEGRG
ncbi:haloperoxidase [[Bacillus] enclensis]|uniref:Pimeloyl-ACP methyl ester carboxylesterase n=1 Tax=[Bacillus] enclensis TaxID=1402860 RepID=A0A0V8HCW1_9BACI|nr:alpha/beta hydrolase [[Bacillus] enclensis]KSU60339.1 haloperoxidase [[Bacillus] enclensis]SCC23343.1 Pimeloyl-ACP methyl ester carboxylesterase [[Bacillus] enclensis]